MTVDVSGFGGAINIIASNTFPSGFTVTQWSNDADPLDFAAVKFADTAMGVNGDLIVWSKAVPLPMVISVIPGSLDDQNLQILADANRAAQGKASAGDVIYATVLYPDGSSVQLAGGRMTDASFGKSISGDARIKTKVYSFTFQTKVGF